MKIGIEYTPNPNARKFVLGSDVTTGSKQFNNEQEAEKDALAKKLFEIDGVESVFYLSNFITVTKTNESSTWSTLEKEISSVIELNLDLINKASEDPQNKQLDENLKKIEEILDDTVRPGLAMDGGGVEVVELTNDMKLYVRYHGACGSCPSSTFATLQAITFILKEHFDERIEVEAI